MRIGLNLLHAYPGIGGVWNYIAGLVKALAEFDAVNTYVAFVNDDSKKLIPRASNFVCVASPVNPRHRTSRVIYENTLLDLKAGQMDIACMHWFANVMTPFSRIPGVVTIHDLLPLHRPDLFSLKKRLYLKTMLGRTIHKARVLLPVSRATHGDLHIVLPAVIDEQFQPLERKYLGQFQSKYALPAKYFLYVAHTYPHKNHTGLLRAYSHLKSGGFEPWPLVLRGDAKEGEPGVNQLIKSLRLENDVIRLPHIQYDELPALYSGAGALVFPSIFEGGGIPVIEAMACGCPVVADRIPAILETAGDAALFFDTDHKNDLSQAMKTIQQNQDLRNKLKTNGKEITKKHDGKNITGKLISAYKMASNSCTRR